jgi:nucleoside-diphosphate-sugar epimerase
VDDMKNALVLGAGGFIGSHLVKKYKEEGYWVRGVDLKFPEFEKTAADDFQIADLRIFSNCYKALSGRHFDDVVQLAADMGGAGFIFTGENDADIIHNSATINLNVAEACKDVGIGVLFYSSSACIYPAENQEDPDNPNCAEPTAWPANPDSVYGVEKICSEVMYQAYARNYNLPVRIARFHNIFGHQGTWCGGREKAPAALMRKCAEAKDGDYIEVWGDGKATRSFLYISECVEGIRKLMQSDVTDILNIGSEEMVTVNELAQMAIDISGKSLEIKNIDGPIGVKGRNSDNNLIQEKLGWQPNFPLRKGMEITYKWINEQVQMKR